MGQETGLGLWLAWPPPSWAQASWEACCLLGSSEEVGPRKESRDVDRQGDEMGAWAASPCPFYPGQGPQRGWGEQEAATADYKRKKHSRAQLTTVYCHQVWGYQPPPPALPPPHLTLPTASTART